MTCRTCIAPEAAAIIAHYGMQPHPEGGHYVRTYQSAGIISVNTQGNTFEEDRHFSTAILYLLRAGEKSRLHRIRQDELWHFYLGGPLRLITISPQGKLTEIRLGRDILAGQSLQYPVPGGYWFGAMPMDDTVYSLVGCTVAPGFDFADFELARTARLKRTFPHLTHVIEEFTA